MKAFKNRLEEMAEATVNALDYSDSKVGRIPRYFYGSEMAQGNNLALV